MKQLFPNHLVARPEHVELNKADIRLGDIVYLQPVNGPQVAGEVIFSSPIFGCNTYTADALINKAGAIQRVRIRFREKDIHRVSTAPSNTPIH